MPALVCDARRLMHRLALALILASAACGTDDPSVTGSDDSTGATGSSDTGATTDGLSQSGGQEGDSDASQLDTSDGGTTQGVDGTAGTTASPTTAGNSTGPSAESTTGSEEGTDSDSNSDTGPNTTGDPGCGNGSVEPGEQCDGDNLQGFDCGALGLGVGDLGCDSVTCTFDTSMCRQGGGTGFGGL
ncbi:MAG: hypothetical protein JKY37_03985 [Nannocystaceae bacterium]|nr:hypothetical protein [Nannocystaceae bacterium]